MTLLTNYELGKDFRGWRKRRSSGDSHPQPRGKGTWRLSHPAGWGWGRGVVKTCQRGGPDRERHTSLLSQIFFFPMRPEDFPTSSIHRSFVAILLGHIDNCENVLSSALSLSLSVTCLLKRIATWPRCWHHWGHARCPGMFFSHAQCLHSAW